MIRYYVSINYGAVTKGFDDESAAEGCASYYREKGFNVETWSVGFTENALRAIAGIRDEENGHGS